MMATEMAAARTDPTCSTPTTAAVRRRRRSACPWTSRPTPPAWGRRVVRARTLDGLRAALADAAVASGPVVVYVEADRYAAVPSFESWWEVPVAELADDPRVRDARGEYDHRRAAQRQYLEPT
jgi:hypothetical protein